jgi:transposase-like protein
MYSYEERLRAVKLYIKLGKRAQATIRELGYPTKNALKGWYREYQRLQDLPIRSAPRPPKFSQAQKEMALEHYATHGRCISWTLRALGYPCRTTMTAWVREAFPDMKPASNTAYGPGNHSDAVKQAAVAGLYSRQESAQSLAEKFGVSRPTLYAWKTQILGPEAPAMMKRKKSALPPELEELERQREALQRDIRELQIEHDLLKTASEMIKKELGGDLRSLSNREKTMLIVALKKRYKTPALLARLGLARSSYFYHRARMKQGDKYLPIRQAMKEAFESNHRCYGCRAYRFRRPFRCAENAPVEARKLLKRLPFVPTAANGSYLPLIPKALAIAAQTERSQRTAEKSAVRTLACWAANVRSEPILTNRQLDHLAAAAKSVVRDRPICMYRLLFANDFSHVLGSRSYVSGLLIDTRVVALLGLRTRRDLITGKVHDDRLGRQTLGA